MNNENSIKKIYVKLLDEGTDVWRPVNAIQLTKNVYKILEDNNYNKILETWEFLPGTIVECINKSKDIGKIKIIIKEYKKSV